MLRTSLLSLLLASSAAIADGAPTRTFATPATNLPPILLDEVPEQCKAIAKQGGAANVQTALSARISLANCIADTKLAQLKLLDCEDSVLAIDEAMKPSLELLDGVIAGALDDTTKIIAEQAKAELHNQMMVRMRQTLPSSTGATESDRVLADVRKGLLEDLLGTWKDAAAGSYERILAIVKAKPALENNPVVATAMRTAKDRLRLHLAHAPARAHDDKAEKSNGAKTDTGEQLR